MALYYVYSPISGTMTSCISEQKYRTLSGGCSCPCAGPHGTMLANRPIDVGGSPYTWLDLIVKAYSGTQVYSVKTVRRYGVACTGSPGGGQDDAVEAWMYTGSGGGGTLIGKVVFGHVYNPIADGYHDTGTFPLDTSKRILYSIGQVPAGYTSGCYEGGHVHMETFGTGYVSASCSGTCPNYTRGSEPLYTFSV